MTQPRNSVAVLLFTRTAGEEARHKRFISHGAGNAAVAAQLIQRAAATARQAGLDFLQTDSRSQRGATFGERLAQALTQAFCLGYEQLLVIGNDCPQLSPRLLRRATTELAATGAVLGPAADGGVYLLGISRASFDAASFAALPWQTANLGAALAGLLHRAGTLPRLTDVDNERDLARVLRQPLTGRLRRVLRRLRTAAFGRLPRVALAGQLLHEAARPHRGPPTI